MQRGSQDLSDRQLDQVDAIGKLLSAPDRGSIQQGIELAVALGDQAVFAALLDGVAVSESSGKARPSFRRYSSLERGPRFLGPRESQTWLDLAMVHLLAGSDLPLRREVTSVALGGPTQRNVPRPELWIEGLERLESLTHLDLMLSDRDSDIDLSPLRTIPNLTHLRLRGHAVPGVLPPLERLRELDCRQIEIDYTSTYPELETIRGRLHIDGPISPAMAPKLRQLQIRGEVRIEGYESLGRLSCSGGAVELPDCRRIEYLSSSVPNFDAPKLRHVGTLERFSPGIDVSQLDSLGAVRMNRTSRFSGGTFPPGTKLLDPMVQLSGRSLNDLGNLGELPGLEVLVARSVKSPVSLETLRHATKLRVLDVGRSTGITDLSPLVGLANLEVIVVHGSGVTHVPVELQDKVHKHWRRLAPRSAKRPS